MKVVSIKNLVKKLFNIDIEGTTLCEELNNIDTPKEILIKSSTANSAKVFKITVVDNGTITATEIVQ